MKYAKAFIAGLTLPSVLLPIMLSIAINAGKPEVLSVYFLHQLPLIWGAWNVLYFLLFKRLSTNRNARLMLTGAVLGFGVAVYGVFALDIPALIGIEGLFRFLPLIIAPLIYALLWRFGVSPLNQLLGIQDDL